MYARRPLTVAELAEVLSIREGDRALNTEVMQEKEILELGRGFIVVEPKSTTLQLTHQTGQIFLQKHHSDDISPKRLDIATTCLRYLQFDEFEKGEERTFGHWVGNYTALHYIAFRWVDHVKDVEDSDYVLPAVITFLASERKRNLMLTLRAYPKDFIGGFTLLQIMDWEQFANWSWRPRKLEMPTGTHCFCMSFTEITRESSYLSILSNLPKRETDINARDNRGQTPLHIASMRGHTEMVKQLLNATADSNVKDESGRTALHIAAENGCVKVVEILLKAVADVDTQTKFGETALHRAAANEFEKVVDILLKAGAEVDKQDEEGETALHNAARNEFDKVIEILLKAGADVNKQERAGGTALQIAAEYGGVKVVEILLKAGAEVDMQDEDGETALHKAVYEGFEQVVETLLKAGAEVDKLTNYGKTALHLAAQNGHVNVAETLLKSGADVNKLDMDDMTALAKVCGCEIVADMLQKAIAESRILTRLDCI